EKTHKLTETLQFKPTNVPEEKKPILEAILNNIHLALGISYWKTYCPKTLKINEFSLTKEQAEFWNMVYTKGLGEFFFRNNIDFRGLINFPFEEKEAEKPTQLSLPNRSLVFFGGGKDSAVSVELLKNAKKEFDLFVVNM